MTNAEKIRTLSDDELAKWIDTILNGGHEWFDAQACERCKVQHGGQCPDPEAETCESVGGEVLDWLKQPADN